MLLRPIKTMKIEDGVYSVRSGIGNFYIVEADGSFIAFDTGMNTLTARLGLKSLGIAPERITHVFLTHSDYDHVGGLNLFRGAEIYLSELEEPMVTGRKPRLLFICNRRLKNFRTLEDRQTVKIGERAVQIISAPGHTAGSACYLVDGKILISGDVLRTSQSGRITPFLFFQNMSHAEDKRSLERLFKEGFIDRAGLILTGHTGILKKA